MERQGCTGESVGAHRHERSLAEVEQTGETEVQGDSDCCDRICSGHRVEERIHRVGENQVHELSNPLSAAHDTLWANQKNDDQNGQRCGEL